MIRVIIDIYIYIDIQQFVGMMINQRNRHHNILTVCKVQIFCLSQVFEDTVLRVVLQ